ncbi:cellulose biosynthesis protein BcsR [Macromonas bipunctata]|uniref:cellulose biosynthesis protein BcsR n=1 Tax=Macromonas bipunctata TaxID=183670 RepID=UPI000C34111D
MIGNLITLGTVLGHGAEDVEHLKIHLELTEFHYRDIRLSTAALAARRRWPLADEWCKSEDVTPCTH